MSSMRSIQAITADIARLKGELANVKAYNHKRDSAVYILENLGWTHTAKSGWKHSVVSSSIATPYSPKEAGVDDIVQHKDTGEYYVVRARIASVIVASKVSRVYSVGCRASSSTCLLEDSNVTVVRRGKLLGKNLCASLYETPYTDEF